MNRSIEQPTGGPVYAATKKLRGGGMPSVYPKSLNRMRFFSSRTFAARATRANGLFILSQPF
jgi:hypothetical protein